MLEVVKYNRDEYNFPCLLVLGCFDGLHIGHAELLKKAKLQAKINGLDLGVMMFADGKDGKQVFTFDERVKYLEKFNVKFVLKIDFTEEFKSTEALGFLKNLEDKLNIKAYMSGKDFRFGASAKGKSSTLKKYAEDDDSGVWYMSVKDVTDGDEKVGTSKIKTMLAAGDITNANRLLGRNFSVGGTVIQGANRGHSVLGFPTINIAYPENKVEIKQGVYTVECLTDDGEFAGIANYGGRPTFGEDAAVLEVYLKGYSGNLYGKTVTVEFTGYIRDIQKFENADALKAQLRQDLSAIGGGEFITETADTAVPAEEIETETAPVEVELIEEVEAAICPAEQENPPEKIEETIEIPVEEKTETASESVEIIIETVEEKMQSDTAFESVEQVSVGQQEEPQKNEAISLSHNSAKKSDGSTSNKGTDTKNSEQTETSNTDGSKVD